MTHHVVLETTLFLALVACICYALLADLRSGKESVIRSFFRWAREILDSIFGLG